MREFKRFPNDFALIDEFGIVVMTIPKAAHTSIMAALVETFGQKRWRAHKNSSWPSDYLSVGFCRHPLDRFRSCWQDKIAPGDVKGGKPGISIDEFSAKVARAEDRELDRHLIPQHYKFFSGGVLRVQELFRYEDLPTAWTSFRDQVRAHCGRHLADLPRMHTSRPVQWEWSEHSRRMIAERYSQDLKLLGYG